MKRIVLIVLMMLINVLRKSLKNLHIIKSDFSHSTVFTVINKYGKGAAIQISNVFGPVYYVACPRVL